MEPSLFPCHQELRCRTRVRKRKISERFQFCRLFVSQDVRRRRWPGGRHVDRRFCLAGCNRLGDQCACFFYFFCGCSCMRPVSLIRAPATQELPMRVTPISGGNNAYPAAAFVTLARTDTSVWKRRRMLPPLHNRQSHGQRPSATPNHVEPVECIHLPMPSLQAQVVEAVSGSRRWIDRS